MSPTTDRCQEHGPTRVCKSGELQQYQTVALWKYLISHLSIEVDNARCALRSAYSFFGQRRRINSLQLLKQKISRQIIQRLGTFGYIHKDPDESTENPCFIVGAAGVSPSLR